MVVLLFYDFLHLCDLGVTLVTVVFLIFSTVKLCIKIPLSPLIAAAILAVASLIALCLTNIKRLSSLANAGFTGSCISFKNGHLSLFPRKLKRGTMEQTNYGSPSSVTDSIPEGVSRIGAVTPSSSSTEFLHRRTPFSIDYINIPSQQHFSPSSHNEIGNSSFFGDYGRRNYHVFQSEDASLITMFADKIAFYSYFDPNVRNINQVKFLRIIFGFNFWLKQRWIKPLLNNSVWVLSGIIVTITWCIIWEWAACYMHRDEGNYNLLHWSVDKVPNEYWMLEGAFQLIFGMTYLLQLYDYEVRCGYILSLRGFIDLTMTPVVTQVITLVSKYMDLDSKKYASINSFGLLFLGPLRFLKLIQAEELLNKSFDHLSDVQTIVIGIATAAVALLCSFSGMMYLFEAPRKSVNFVTPFDFIYFGVATMGTVGYGDFTPNTFIGRVISVFLICTCISLGAVHFKRLKEALSTKGINMGSTFDLNGKRYVLFWGPLSEYQLLTFCRCISNSFDGVIDTVVIATPLPLKSYKVVYRAIKRNTRIKIYMIGGSNKICAPSHVYKLIGFSMLTVVVNDMEAYPSHEHVNNDDRIAILRSMACYNISRHLHIPVSVQMHSSDYAGFMKSTSISRICFLKNLKYKLFAKSVGCRGLFYLILTLFHTPTNIRRTRAYVEDLYNLFASYNADTDEEAQEATAKNSLNVTRQLFEIVNGMQFQLYKLNFPSCIYGLKFIDVCQYLYKAKNMFLIGIVSSDKCILNPVDYIIGSQYDRNVYMGLVIAMSLKDVLHVSMLKGASLDFLPHKSDDLIPVGNFQDFIPIIPPAQGVIYENREIKFGLFRDIHRVDNYEEALQAFAEPKTNLVLVCGWLYDMHCFLKDLLSCNNSNVICLSPMETIEDNAVSLSVFRNSVVYIDGSPMDVNDLERAGTTHASCIIVLNCEQSSTRCESNQLPTDSQVLFVRHLIKEVIASSQASAVFKLPNIILDIQHSLCLEYLDPSLVSSMEAECSRDAMNRVWQNFGEFMTSYEMASGTIFVQDMLYGLLAHSYVPCIHAVGYDTIDHMLQTDAACDFNNIISLEDVPIVFNGKAFKSLFRHKLFLQNRICIGILRTYKDPSVNSELKQLVIVAPQPSFVILAEDKVYVVNPNKLSFT